MINLLTRNLHLIPLVLLLIITAYWIYRNKAEMLSDILKKHGRPKNRKAYSCSGCECECLLILTTKGDNDNMLKYGLNDCIFNTVCFKSANWKEGAAG